MSKKILIGVGIILLFIVVLITYIVIADLKQEAKLIAELNEISEMSNKKNINVDKIYEKLNQITTKGDYAKVERAFKNYLKDNFDNSLKIAEILKDETIITLLTAENYLKDGKDFINTKKYIEETKEKLDKYKQEYVNFFTEEKAMSYIKNEKIDNYYINLYKKEFVDDIKLAAKDKTVENSIDKLIEVLNISEQIIILLSKNQDTWKIEGENIVFNNDTISNEYNKLVENLK